MPWGVCPPPTPAPRVGGGATPEVSLASGTMGRGSDHPTNNGGGGLKKSTHNSRLLQARLRPTVVGVKQLLSDGGEEGGLFAIGWAGPWAGKAAVANDWGVGNKQLWGPQ